MTTSPWEPFATNYTKHFEIVKKLKNWLKSWKDFDEELKSLVKSNNKNKCSESDGDDFDDDDDFFIGSEKLKPPHNVCLLSGPNGCGKTALVTALAEELEFNIIEVNASSKRTGKP